MRLIHLFVLLSLMTVGPAHAVVVRSCAPAAGADDERAVQVARVSALSAFARQRGIAMVSGVQSVTDTSHRHMVLSSTVVSTSRARIVSRDFRPGNGSPGQVCVDVDIADN